MQKPAYRSTSVSTVIVASVPVIVVATASPVRDAAARYSTAVNSPASAVLFAETRSSGRSPSHSSSPAAASKVTSQEWP